MIISGFYVSIWDDSIKLISPCKINLDTREVFDIEQVDIEGVDLLTDEYLLDSNKEYFEQVYQKDEANKFEYWYE